MLEIYMDNMVLQYGCLLIIQGKVDVGEKVIVFIDRQKFQVVMGVDGKWVVDVWLLKVGGLYMLIVFIEKWKLVYENVLVGEVWFCFG